MGEPHPASRKVVVQFAPTDLSLTPQQQLKLKKLAGARYNPSRDIIKMSCEKFDTPAQNKRYLGDLVNTLITEAKDESDTFEDIPIDLRHYKHKSKPKPRYPLEWRLSEESAGRILLARNEKRQLADAIPAVDGENLVQNYIRGPPEEKQRVPVMAASRPGPGANRLRR